jgi:hypothetical protein
MPRYEIILEKNKTKVIRASSLEIAEERASKMEVDGWMVNRIYEQKGQHAESQES